MRVSFCRISKSVLSYGMGRVHLVLATFVAGCLAGTALGQQRYQVMPLDYGSDFRFFDINNLGDLLGGQSVNDGASRVPVVVTSEGVTRLQQPYSYYWAVHGTINDRLEAVFTMSGTSTNGAFHWANNRTTTLPGQSGLSAGDMNQSGDIVGSTEECGESCNGPKATVWRNLQPTVLGPKGTSAGALNEASYVGGSFYDNAERREHPRLWDPSGQQITVASHPTKGVSIMGISENLELVARTHAPGVSGGLYYATPDSYEEILFQGMSVIPQDYSDGIMIGRSNQVGVVGRFGSLEDFRSISDFEGVGFSGEASLLRIKSSGIILGQGQRNGQPTYFVATPVPEPSSFVALGLVSLYALSKRKSMREPKSLGALE